MALTMTRTRTQTTLTKLAELLANVHGELKFLEGLLLELRAERPALSLAALLSRREVLLANRDALYATLRQFDGAIDPERIAATKEWRKKYGNNRLGRAGLVSRYLSGVT